MRYAATLPGDAAEDPALLEPFTLCVDVPFLLSGDAGQAKFTAGSDVFRYKNQRKLCVPRLDVQDDNWGLAIGIGFPSGTEQTWVYPVQTYAVDNNKWVREFQGTNVVARIPLASLLDKEQAFTYSCQRIKEM
jgi:hypothetical protein